jgi:hypothetical protein
MFFVWVIRSVADTADTYKLNEHNCGTVVVSDVSKVTYKGDTFVIVL